jgi:hypothetical protein
VLLLLIALALVGWQSLRASRGLDTPQLRPPPLLAFGATLIVLFGLPLSALAQNLLGLRNPISVAAFGIAAGQSYMLWRLLGAAPKATAASKLVAGAALLAIVSLASPLLTSSDPYFYVGAGILGFQTYEPPHMPFRGEFSPLNYQFVVDGTTYGPLWVALNTFVVSCGSRGAGGIPLVRHLELAVRAGGKPSNRLFLLRIRLRARQLVRR